MKNVLVRRKEFKALPIQKTITKCGVTVKNQIFVHFETHMNINLKLVSIHAYKILSNRKVLWMSNRAIFGLINLQFSTCSSISFPLSEQLIFKPN